MENHLHILSDLHPNLALAYFIRDIKTASSIWLKESSKFPKFEGWADGYAALTYWSQRCYRYRGFHPRLLKLSSFRALRKEGSLINAIDVAKS